MAERAREDALVKLEAINANMKRLELWYIIMKDAQVGTFVLPLLGSTMHGTLLLGYFCDCGECC